MSIMIMSRLFRMNLGGCNRKLLAVRLADFADDEGRGIYPGVKRLANETELSERTIQRILSDFVSEGILVVVKEATGRPGQTTRYDFNLSRLFSYVPESTGVTVSPVGETSTGDNPAERGDTDDREGCHGVTRTVIEPPIEPSPEREGASAVSENLEDDPHKLTKRVKVLEIGTSNNPWPGAAGSSTQWAVTQFRALSPEDRKLAEERRDAYLDLCKAQRVKPVAVGVYIRDRKFEDVTAARVAGSAPVARDGRIMVPVFGPVWAAARMLPLLSGPVDIDMPDDLRQRVEQTYRTHQRSSHSRAEAYVHRMGISISDDDQLLFPDDFEAAEMRRRSVTAGYPEAIRLHDAARERHHVSVRALLEGLKDLCEAVPLGSAVWDAWRDHHEAMGWPFVPQPAGMKVVYFPKGGPEALEEFERAARSLMAARNDDDAA